MATANAQASAAQDTTDFSKMSLEQIQALIEKATAAKTEKYNAERSPILESIKAQIAQYKFTPEELGMKAVSGKAPSAASGGDEKKEKRKNNVTNYLKSCVSDETGMVRAHLPGFMKDEGVVEAFKAGKSIDGWLIDPSDNAKRAIFIKKLQEVANKKATKEQLGSIPEADIPSFTTKSLADKVVGRLTCSLPSNKCTCAEKVQCD